MSYLKNAAVVCSLALFPALSHAAQIMPSFDGAPAGWTVDRYAPTSFSDVGMFQGRDNVLGISITSAGDLANRPAPYRYSFYNTQGEQHAVAGGAGSVLAADLYVPTAWGNAANGSVRTDMWGVMTAGATVTDYTIIGFSNYGGAARFRVWDQDTANGWVDLATAIQFDSWNSLSIDFTGSSYVYSINGSAVYTDTTIGGSTDFSATIMQAYNFADPAIAGASLSDYTAHWSNASVPEVTGTWMLMGLGMIALAGYRVRLGLK